MGKGRRRIAFEIKASLSPRFSRGFPVTLELLQPEKTWVVCLMTEAGCTTRTGARIVGIEECLQEIEA
jgi:predicted RNase H-like HicB family nuclease